MKNGKKQREYINEIKTIQSSLFCLIEETKDVRAMDTMCQEKEKKLEEKLLEVQKILSEILERE